MKKALFLLLGILLMSIVNAENCIEMGVCFLESQYEIKGETYNYYFNPYTDLSIIHITGQRGFIEAKVPLRTKYNLWFKQCDYSDFLEGGWNWPEETVKKKTAECMNGFTSFKEFWVAFHLNCIYD